MLGCALVLGACQSAQLPQAPRDAQPAAAVVAEQANASGDELLQQAASERGLRATALYLSAAEAYMAQGDWNGVQAAVASATEANQRADLFLRYANLNAALALKGGDAAGAEQWLHNREPALLELGGRDPTMAATATLQAAVCEAQQRWSCAANSLMLLDDPQAFADAPWFGSTHHAGTAVRAPLSFEQSTPRSIEALLPPEKVLAQRLNEQIWHYVSLTPASVAETQDALRNRAQQGWWALRSAAAQGHSLAEQRQSVKEWQRRFSAHQAQSPWPATLTAVLQQQDNVRSVAVMLPLSGPLSAAGNAVRNGFIATQLRDNTRLSAYFYDTSAEPLPALFERAMTQGADVVVGPLAKTQVETLQTLNPTVPVLALNYLGEGEATAPGVLQLGLAIEDEADTLARHLTQQGLTRVLIVHSEQDWSVRAANRLQAQVGESATLEAFANAKTVTEAVGRGMFVEESRQRSQKVYQQIGTHIEFVPRARRDLDAIVALVSNTEAKVLVPALKFHFGNHLPVYATGQATRGASSADLKGLSGFQITELPWFVNDNTRANSLADEVTQAFRLTGNNLAALYALGSDAYRIADRLPLLAKHRDLNFEGGSGALSVRPDGRFTRELAWGVIAQSRLMAIPRVTTR